RIPRKLDPRLPGGGLGWFTSRYTAQVPTYQAPRGRFLMSVVTESAETFASLNPATGEVVAEHPVHDGAAVAAAVERAREAAEWWRALGWKERRLRLLNVKGSLARNLNRMAELIHQETGKP